MGGEISKVTNDVTAPILGLFGFSGKVTLTAIKGRDFPIEKKTFDKDIPDVYLQIKYGSNPAWKTSIVKDNQHPVWNESKLFEMTGDEDVIVIEAWDHDSGVSDPDDFLGKVEVKVFQLLQESGGTKELQLTKLGYNIDSFVTIKCVRS